MVHNTKLPLIAILGPTASGKSALAFSLAQKMGGEIVSCDSMQIYRGLDIGTAKASYEERSQIPHHCIDILDIEESFSLACYIQIAKSCIFQIRQRSHVPIIVGGTGLYAKGLLYGYHCLPTDFKIREELAKAIQNGRENDLWNELYQAHPELAVRLKPNRKRWLRALEILRIQKQLPSRLSSSSTIDVDLQPVREYILLPPREFLKERIRLRIAQMLSNGWIQEVQKIGVDRLKLAPLAGKAIGYREIIQYLEGKLPDFNKLQETIVKNTWQYAKRQYTWFRHQHPCAQFLPEVVCTSPSDMVNWILSDLNSKIT